VALDVSFDDAVESDRAGPEPAFVVDIDGFEGPLDLQIELARRQRIDLHKISILPPAKQYLHVIATSRRMRLELAADYLVMAAWLAYLKSRLLLPDPPAENEPAAADLAADFARRLQRLEQFRQAGKALADRPRLGRDVFARGGPEALSLHSQVTWKASLFDLLSAYARQRRKQAQTRVTVERRIVWSLAQAREALERLLGRAADWSVLDDCLAGYLGSPEAHRTVRASTFVASLEMAREGRIELRQERPFAPLWLRSLAARDAGTAQAG
jgi:segregation and condensation protein A